MKYSFDQNKRSYAAAANIVDIGAINSALADASPKVEKFGQAAIANQAAERNAQRAAEAAMISTGLSTLSNVKSAKMVADAQVAAAKAQAAASQSSSMMGGIGSIIGAGLSLFSDRDTKENIERLDDALETLRQLKPVSFNYLPEYSTSPERLHYGFIAQEYKEVMPDATYYDESTKKLCIDPVELIGLLVRSVQQLESRVQYLEATKALAEVK